MKILRTTSKEWLWYPSPGLLTRATLSRRERDLHGTFRITCPDRQYRSVPRSHTLLNSGTKRFARHS